MNTPQFEADKNRLVLSSRTNTYSRTYLTDTLDRSVDSFVFTNKDNAIVFTVGDQGRSTIMTVDLITKAIQSGMRQHSNTHIATIPHRDGQIAFSRSSTGVPNEFYTMSLDTFEPVQLTHVHLLHLKAVAISKAEEFWFKGAMDEPVMGWILKPADFDPTLKYPLAFLIHGGPQSAWTDAFSFRYFDRQSGISYLIQMSSWNPQVFAGSGFVVVAINFHGSTGYGQNFTNSISKEWGSHPFEDLMKVFQFTFNVDCTLFMSGPGLYSRRKSIHRSSTSRRIGCFIRR